MTSVVIDVGCARIGAAHSMERLIDEFHPKVLYGFDPMPGSMAQWLPRSKDTEVIL